MNWSAEQERALDAVSRWHQRIDNQVFRLFGYAGTGKTTLAKYFAEACGGQVYFAAFTGKAAYVLQQKGCFGASTIHSLIYRPKIQTRAILRQIEDDLIELRSQLVRDGLTQHDVESDRRVVALLKELEKERENLKRPAFSLNLDSPINDASLVIVDESSMIDKRMAEDLLSFGAPILALGDPAQLPPVMSNEGYFTGKRPDFMLMEIHRQAQESPIIRLASQVRQKEELEYGDYGSSRVIDWADVEPEDGLKADQIIVGTHKLRRGTNNRIRELLNLQGAAPCTGDRLVCLRNDKESGLLNGGIWNVQSSMVADEDTVVLEINSETGDQNLTCDAHMAPFLGRDIPHWHASEAQSFDFGYAITCHKAQGSQWDKVLVFDQSKTFREQQHRWLYTAITRAAEEIVIVKP